MNERESARRRRWISVGETIALAALMVSALGVWISWKGSGHDQPTRVIEQRSAIALTLRAKAADDGRTLEIAPVEAGHALQALKVTLPHATPIEVGSDGDLSAGDVQAQLRGHEKDPKGRTLTAPVRVDARYVELGQDRRSSGSYTLRYRWEGGGLFGGRSLRLVGLSRG
jgi:hypothetical protein